MEALLGYLEGEKVAGATHSELEEHLGATSRDVVCCMLREHLELRALREQRIEEVTDAGGAPRAGVESDHHRPLVTIFGEVRCTRLAYRRRGEQNLYVADAELNLPEEVHSHGLRELVAIESSRGSFDEAKEGAVRWLVRDRMDVTGTRWGLQGAEAVPSSGPYVQTTTRWLVSFAHRRQHVARTAPEEGLFGSPEQRSGHSGQSERRSF